ncbi:MAG: acetyl-CoA carboxylase biotin carboxyl carrier protein [Planctomycetota bacterium]|jgi:acetyl-CoA carboxylase biotin carboxyl carrier protein
MDHRELKKLVQLMNDNELVELEIEEEGRRVALRKAGANAAAAHPPAPYVAPPAPPAAPAPAPAPETADDGPPPGTREIRSPMVGTFYRRPSPDAEPYAQVGDHINADTVVCIVEAMKVNNEIKAETEGEILEILVEDGQPVEFDQPLFLLKAG